MSKKRSFFFTVFVHRTLILFEEENDKNSNDYQIYLDFFILFKYLIEKTTGFFDTLLEGNIMKIKEFFTHILISAFFNSENGLDKDRIRKIISECQRLKQIQKNSKKLFFETGRTMMEMLSALAVVGILSTTAIFGYRYGMIKYIANETINELNLRVHDISLDMDKLIENNYVGDIQMGMGPVTRMGYPIIAQTSSQYMDYFIVFLKNVPSDVCRELLLRRWKVPYSIFVEIDEYTDDTSICYQNDKVEIIYEFQKDLLSKEEIENENRHETQRCAHSNHCKCGTCNPDNGVCEGCPAGEQCVKSFEDPRWFMCCRFDSVVSGVCCNEIKEGQCCTSGGQCCPKEKPLRDRNGGCHACDELRNVDVGSHPEYCSVCPKRYLAGGYPDRNYCSLCGVEGTMVADKPLVWDTQTSCYSCDYQDNGSLGQIGIKDDYLCENVCPNRIFLSPNSSKRCTLPCPTDKPLRADYGNNSCKTCDIEAAISTTFLTEPCSTICPNREEKNGYCILKDCPADKPLKDRNGGCHTCDELKNVDVGSHPEYCSVCPKRYLAGGYPDRNYCSLCGVEGTMVADKPLVWDTQTSCYSCDYQDNGSLGQIGIKDDYLCENVCPNRIFLSPNSSKRCTLPCPTDKPLRADYGNNSCKTCDIEAAISTTFLTEPCSTICPNREEKNGYCILKDCPADKPLKDRNGACHTCDELKGVNVGKGGKCSEVCPKRRLMGGWNVPGNDYCSLCGVEETAVANKPLFNDNSDGTCYSCDVTGVVNQQDIYLDYQCSNVCPNRKMLKASITYGDNRCVLKCTDPNKPLMNNSFQCQPCNYTGSVRIEIQDGMCSEMCPNRIVEGNNCILSDSCPDGFFMGADNLCYKCNISLDIHVPFDSNECERCLNRTLHFGVCSLKD